MAAGRPSVAVPQEPSALGAGSTSADHYNLTMLQCYNATILHYTTTILQYYNTTILPRRRRRRRRNNNHQPNDDNNSYCSIHNPSISTIITPSISTRACV